LSHGISSIIIFLSRVVESGIADKKAERMLSGAVNYVLSQEKDFSQFGSCFPNYILKDLPESVSKSRLAWCYGDLGIGMALWRAGKALENTEWKNKGFEILLQSTQRRTFGETSVQDAGICHGCAGITMIFRRMYLETDREEFKKATHYWIQQTLNFSKFEDGFVGYKTVKMEGMACDYSFLTGISGIGLVLLSFLENDPQTWDEIFLIS
jgi:lantibiotic modifying enzyme